MLVLFETPAGYAVFKLLDEGKLAKSDSLYEDFESIDKARNVVKLKQFQKFEDTTEALSAATAAVEGKMSKSLKKLLKKVIAEDAHEKLAVADAKLGGSIQEKLDLSCVYDSKIGELMRCIRSQISGLISGLPDKEMAAMELGLAHSLSRYKLKFSPDKIDTMIVQVVEIQEYRGQLYEYLKNRMMAIAPNLTVLVGELVGARLIAHAGTLMNLAKHPASTVQILGAEKALFKALKTKHDTPKYGLIYHAQLVGSSGTKLKGKVSRMLAAKASLACRVDALGEETNTDLGIEHRAKVESRIRQLEGGEITKISATAKQSAKFDKYESKSEVLEYKAAADVTLKRKAEDDDEEKPDVKKIKVEDVEAEGSKKKKKKKDKQKEEEVEAEAAVAVNPEKKKKKKDKETVEAADSTLDTSAMDTSVAENGEKKKKKKKKKDGDGE